MGAVEAAGHGLHILVNNAALCIHSPLSEMSLATWRRQNAVNLDSVFLGTRAALEPMSRSGGGSVVNISSVAGLKGSANLAGYCATKGGVRLFTKAVAMECAAMKDGIRCNSVHPGIIDTPIWQKIDTGGVMAAAVQPGANALDVNVIGTAAPVGFAGLPADIAAGVVFLASDASRYMTGSELVIDGGLTVR